MTVVVPFFWLVYSGFFFAVLLISLLKSSQKKINAYFGPLKVTFVTMS